MAKICYFCRCKSVPQATRPPADSFQYTPLTLIHFPL